MRTLALRAVAAARIGTTLVLVGMLAVVVARRLGVDLGESARARAVVHVGATSPAVAGAEVVETAAVGRLIDDGVGGVVLELTEPRPYSMIDVPDGRRRIRHRGGIYDDYEAFFGTPVPPGVLEFLDALGLRRRVVVEFGYPDHDSETGTLVYHLRRLAGASSTNAGDDGLPLQPGEITGAEVTIRVDR